LETLATQIIAGSVTFNDQVIYLFNTHWHASLYANKETFDRLSGDFLNKRITSEKFIEKMSDAVDGYDWRMGEATGTLDFIEKVAGNNPVILMGDFNALSTSDQIMKLKASGFIDTYQTVNKNPGYTWDEKLNSNIRKYQLSQPIDENRLKRKRIDYIFVRGENIDIIKSNLVFDFATDNVHPSDHFGLVTEIKIPVNP
jgi:endonuclease/exonuclease/phosphatase family metal-dependent hydrolase